MAKTPAASISNEDALADDITVRETVYELVAIAFSLWRAVFLSDSTGDAAGQLADAKRFLQSLIAHNAVLYQTDFNAREWTFRYYLDHALDRLKSLPVDILPNDRQPKMASSTKDDWNNAQVALEAAVANFRGDDL